MAKIKERSVRTAKTQCLDDMGQVVFKMHEIENGGDSDWTQSIGANIEI